MLYVQGDGFNSVVPKYTNFLVTYIYVLKLVRLEEGIKHLTLGLSAVLASRYDESIKLNWKGN